MTSRNYTLGVMIFMAVGLAIALSGCNKNESFPAPKSGFEVVTEFPEVGLPVKFSNLSTNAATYSWDFGDGTDSTNTSIAPEHTYTAPGTYTVSLTSTTADNQTSTETKEVKIGQRYLIEVDVLAFPDSDPNGDPWHDDGTNPDLMLYFAPSAQPTDSALRTYFSPVIRDIGKGDTTKLPFYLSLSNSEVIPITNEDYDFFLLDFHGIPDYEVSNANLNDQVIFGIQPFNPITGTTRTIIGSNSGTGIGYFKIVIDQGDYIFEMYFAIDYSS